jgi:hypothetical protein
MWEPRPLATLGAFMACNRDLYLYFEMTIKKEKKLRTHITLKRALLYNSEKGTLRES